MSAVSQGTLAVAPGANRRRYRSPKRASVAEATRQALIKAALALIGEGRFRFGAQELADRAGVRRQAICRYFGSVDLLYRVLAREHWPEVASHLPFALGICDFDDQYARAAVWAVLVGRPKDEATHG